MLTDIRISTLSLVILLTAILIGCGTDDRMPIQKKQIDYLIPSAITDDNEPLFEHSAVYVNDYSNFLHGLFMIAGNSRSSEYGNENYRPELYPDKMNQWAVEWLNLMHFMDLNFNRDGRFVNRHEPDDSGLQSTDELDLSIYPHLVYSYHMHHRGDRFNDDVLYERLSRETSNFIVMPGRFLLSNLYEDGLFFHEDVTVDHKSMSYGLAGIHGHGYAWIIWAKPEGEDNMGLMTEDALEMWLDYSIDELLDIYRAIAVQLNDSWLEDYSVYHFGDGYEWSLDAIGAMIRGKKVMYDFLYMFGNEDDFQTAVTLFERTVKMFENVVDLVKPWGLPNRIRFSDQGAEPASDEVNLYHWYQFLNHLGGGYSFDREREGTSQFINNRAPQLRNLFSDLYDQVLTGALDYHFSDENRIYRILSYEDGTVIDDSFTVSAAGMFITAAGNIYTNSTKFVRADSWNSQTEEIVRRSRKLYDLKFNLFETMEYIIYDPQ